MAVHMNNLRGVRKMDKVPNVWIRKLSGVVKCVDGSIYEGVLRWFGHVEKMEMTGSLRGSMWEYAGSRSVFRPRKTWVDSAKKSDLDVREARRMVQARNVWRGFVRGNAWGGTRGMNL